MLDRWKSSSLRTQLVAMIMALLIVALTVTGAGTLALLHSYLQGQVDEKLNAAVGVARNQGSFSQLQAPNPVPTDYSLLLFAPARTPYRSAATPISTPTSSPCQWWRHRHGAWCRTRSAERTAKTGGSSPFRSRPTRAPASWSLACRCRAWTTSSNMPAWWSRALACLPCSWLP
ncbi:hypothetical protein [Arthrobacter sp. SD76]|uniref:hypothetical protein n=1 Tax=Arthrobacter sp. SD76 TaxID=3415007 RepID=UPI003C796738